MHRKTKQFILRVFVLSTLIILLFNIGDYYLKANTNTNLSTSSNEEITKTNQKNFKKANYSGLGNTSVAIVTNIGTSYTQINKLPATIYKEIFSINDLVSGSEASNELIGNNMLIIQEYLNVVKTDVKNLINSSSDKQAILNAFIDQLEFRYESGIESQRNLITQRDIFIGDLDGSDASVEILKTKIAEDFKSGNSKASLENIDEYVRLKEQYFYAKIYISYIDQFLKQYQFLNEYTKELASVLINNKEAIIKDAYLVIPKEGGIEALADFNLIFEQE